MKNSVAENAKIPQIRRTCMKKTNKFLATLGAALLSFTLVFSAACGSPEPRDSIDSASDPSQNALPEEEYNYVLEYKKFGSYPQSRVTDETLYNDLCELLGALPEESGAENWTSYGYYLNSTNSVDYAWYKDVTLENAKYRGVYFTKNRPWNSTNESSSSRQTENGYAANAVYWFKFEPLKWRVLQKKDGEAFLACASAIDAMQFRYTADKEISNDANIVYANNYEKSDVRAWLNANFYETAFSNEEKSAVLITTVNNGKTSSNQVTMNTWDNQDEEKYLCPDTEDKVFLLCESEANNPVYGFKKSQSEKDEFRAITATDYAKCQGCKIEDDNGACRWWLRTPYNKTSSLARCVMASGKLDTNNYVYDTATGIVPAIRISL